MAVGDACRSALDVHLLERLAEVRKDLDGTKFAFSEHNDYVEAICPWGNRVRCYEPDPARFGPVNLGNPDEFTIAELARLAIELSGSESRVIVKPPRPDDPVRRKPNIDLARTVLGWEPKTALRPGLEKSIQHFKEVLGLGKA